MIKFFRKIRQKLIEQSKVRSYLLYAIGEVILVVIGILIALQINNWKEKKTDRLIEQKILNSLLIDINADIETITYMIEGDSLLVESNKRLIAILKNEQSEYSSDFEEMFGEMNRYDTFYPNNLGYESLKSKGLLIVKNDRLKLLIINLYDYHYPNIADIVDLKKQLFLNTNLIFNKYLETKTEVQNVQSRFPNDFNALKTNTEFINTLTNLTAEQSLYIGINKFTLEVMKNTSFLIKKELLND